MKNDKFGQKFGLVLSRTPPFGSQSSRFVVRIQEFVGDQLFLQKCIDLTQLPRLHQLKCGQKMKNSNFWCPLGGPLREKLVHIVTSKCAGRQTFDVE